MMRGHGFSNAKVYPDIHLTTLPPLSELEELCKSDWGKEYINSKIKGVEADESFYKMGLVTTILGSICGVTVFGYPAFHEFYNCGHIVEGALLSSMAILSGIAGYFGSKSVIKDIKDNREYVKSARKLLGDEKK